MNEPQDLLDPHLPAVHDLLRRARDEAAVMHDKDDGVEERTIGGVEGAVPTRRFDRLLERTASRAAAAIFTRFLRTSGFPTRCRWLISSWRRVAAGCAKVPRTQEGLWRHRLTKPPERLGLHRARAENGRGSSVRECIVGVQRDGEGGIPPARRQPCGQRPDPD